MTPGEETESPGPYKVGDLVTFPGGNVFTRWRTYATHIDQATADRLNREWQVRQTQG